MPEARGDIREIIGEPVFIPLFKLFLAYGPIFKLSFGPKTFVIVSDPALAKQVGSHGMLHLTNMLHSLLHACRFQHELRQGSFWCCTCVGVVNCAAKFQPARPALQHWRGNSGRLLQAGQWWDAWGVGLQ